MKEMPPCYKCEDRILGCHATCDKYKDWNAKHKQEQNEAYEYNHKQYIYDRYKAERSEANRRRRRK